MKKLLLFFLLPVLVQAQPAQDIYVSFPATTPLLGTDSIKIWFHIPANYPASGGGVIVGLHGLGDPNSSPDIRTYLTATSDNYGLLLACAEPYLGQEDAVKLAKSKAVINETMDSVSAWYHTDLTQTYLCGYSAGSDVASHYTLEDPAYPVKGLIWFAPGFHGSLLYPTIDTAFAAPIPPICMCRGTTDLVSQSGAAKIESIFSGSEVPFLKVSPAGIGHTMNYPGFTADIATCMNFINNNSPLGISESALLRAKVFPNPASDKIMVEAESGVVIQAELLDISGKILFRETSSVLKVIPLSNLSSGIYFIRLKDDSGHSGVQRFIKE
ncbi:MAG: T9SS type A sorting domain-containing protein [Bacteroidota bacterium]